MIVEHDSNESEKKKLLEISYNCKFMKVLCGGFGNKISCWIIHLSSIPKLNVKKNWEINPFSSRIIIQIRGYNDFYLH